jgi:hypothetical protein
VEELIVAKTADRSTLGCVNSMAVMYEDVIDRSGGMQHADLADLNHALRRNTNGARGYQRPVDLTAAYARCALTTARTPSRRETANVLHRVARTLRLVDRVVGTARLTTIHHVLLRVRNTRSQSRFCW